MESLEQTLRRLDKEREEADRRYNDALTALDRSVPVPAEWPSPHAIADDSQLASINAAWDIAAAAPAAQSGWRGRLAGFIWRTIGPYLQRQASFNSRVVDHLNRNAATARHAHQRAEEATVRLREEFARLAEFHARTLQYLQEITAYVDTRDRRAAGGAMVLNAALGALAENMDKRWESLSVRDQRADARASALTAGHDELRAMIGVVHQASLSLKREVERLRPERGAERPSFEQSGAESPRDPSTGSGSSRAGSRDESERGWGPASAEKSGQNVSVSAPTLFRSLDSYKYVGFEDQFRGSREAIRARLESYLPFFATSEAGAGDVLDIGCGRGEFLELLAGAGVRARGIDLNHEMAELCRSRGLDVTEADAVGYLATIPDASLGGIFASQVVEHLQPGYLLQFLELAFHKVRPGGRVILETLNPACWVAFFDSYIRDITHVWPLHPDTLKYLVLASGFARADLEYRSPVAPEDRLQAIALPGSSDEKLADLVEAFNANVEKLNARLFTHRDYAVIGVR
jgi:SAM-dependent methyltransferase